MKLTSFIDIAIGLTLMYLGASLFVTIVNELIAQYLTLRGRYLVTSLAKIIDDPKTRQALSGVPTLAPLFGGPGRPASYVDPAVFANALIGAVGGVEAGASSLKEFAVAIGKLPECSMRTQLLGLARSGSDKLDEFVTNVGAWVNGSLTMLGEGYKTHVRALSLGIGLLVAGLFNLDTFSVASHLSRDAASRAALLAAGSQLVEKVDKDRFAACLAAEPTAKGGDCTVVRELALAVASPKESKLGALPIGWGGTETFAIPSGPFTFRLLGWSLTALAISLGAPFWFDLLSMMVSVRHGMDKPKTDPK